MTEPNDRDELTERLWDGVYVAVGLGVLSFQRSQIARRKLAEVIGDQVNEVEDRVDEVCEQIEALLPDPVADVVSVGRKAGRTSRARLLGIEPG